MSAVLLETQKKAFQGKTVDYPVSQIKIIDKNTFSIKCRDSKTADTFEKITTAYANTSPFVLPEERSFELLKTSPTEFVLRGKDAQKVLEDFSETGLLSNKLFTEVLNAVNIKTQSCVIS